MVNSPYLHYYKQQQISPPPPEGSNEMILQQLNSSSSNETCLKSDSSNLATGKSEINLANVSPKMTEKKEESKRGGTRISPSSRSHAIDEKD